MSMKIKDYVKAFRFRGKMRKLKSEELRILLADYITTKLGAYLGCEKTDFIRIIISRGEDVNNLEEIATWDMLTIESIAEEITKEL